MVLPILGLGIVSFFIAWVMTFAMIRIAPRIGFVDRPGHRKIHHNPKPLGGGVAIFLGIALPMLIGIAVIGLVQPMAAERDALIAGARQQTPIALAFLAAMLGLHVMGLIDDRRALGPFIKLAVQLLAAAALVLPFPQMRVLTALGPPVSIVLTILWITAITNAFNFLDNMDGLSAGVAAVCATALLVTTLYIEQWFVAATLALLLGSLLGFLWFNFPPAKIFMGDSGSLLIGFVLGVLTVRTTYLRPDEQFAAGWYAVFAPVIVLALPLYDLIVVSLIRVRRGKSPFVGDTNHFSHRLVARGMSRRTAVLCIYLVTAATAVAAIVLPLVQSTLGAMLLFGQTVLILCMVALLEQHPLPRDEMEPRMHTD
jgi:UDP-GlcNAc:undecaprenyl-phosphate/decaprenyl-phosphate GlcNAc-1-phosphate transferase